MDFREFGLPVEARKEGVMSVGEVAGLMRESLKAGVGVVQVEGEVSNLRTQGSGHIYFTLKDERAQLSCAFFRGYAQYCRVKLRDGMKVVIGAEADFYEQRGQAQLIVRSVRLAGEGELQRKFEALKARLAAEGLFDADRKKPMPLKVGSVGLITSGTGAALQDMLHVFERRAPWMRLYLWPVPVQGEGAEVEIARAVRQWGGGAEGLPVIDVLIVARGGGSLEDLWNFNEEEVVRAIAGSRVPVVTGIGHEIDFTLADFAADLRAPTPSAAAEVVSPDGERMRGWLVEAARGMRQRLQESLERRELQLQAAEQRIRSGVEYLLMRQGQRVDEMEWGLRRGVERAITDIGGKLDKLEMTLRAYRPEAVLEQREAKLGELGRMLDLGMAGIMERRARALVETEKLLRALGPESAFERGFSVLYRESDGYLVGNAADVESGELYRIKMKGGEARVRGE